MNDSFLAVGLYTGLLGLIFTWQLVNISKVRMKEGVFMGDKGNVRVIRAMRGQANFVENVPLILIMLMIMAAAGTPILLIHALGVVLVIGRFLHGYHFIQDDAPGWQRHWGAILSTIVLIVGSVGLIGHGIAALF
ncbi:MAG: glutathione S-transferase [Rhodobacteraceae bacterium]|nr:MAG: glutathione S-transferase [Paracoccaceae bacterium]